MATLPINYRQEQSQIFNAVMNGNPEGTTLAQDVNQYFLNHTEMDGFFEGKSKGELETFNMKLIHIKIANRDNGLVTAPLEDLISRLNNYASKKFPKTPSNTVNRTATSTQTPSTTAPTNQTPSTTAPTKTKKSSKKESKVVSRAATTSQPSTMIGSTHKTNQVEKAVSTSSVPAPVLEKREPKTSAEKIAVMNYMAEKVINGSACDNKATQINRMKILAKNSVYDQTGTNPQSFQGRLAFMHKPSFDAFKAAHPYLF
ncbi:MAG: hypothetical protein H7A38_00235 [Chlamydiales bacterium]|nr:hypothetical protein [Chlamydiales bacterium]